MLLRRRSWPPFCDRIAIALFFEYPLSRVANWYTEQGRLVHMRFDLAGRSGDVFGGKGWRIFFQLRTLNRDSLPHLRLQIKLSECADRAAVVAGWVAMLAQ